MQRMIDDIDPDGGRQHDDRRSVRRARAYLAAQALAGAVWWIGVFTSDDIRRWTLGGLQPALIVLPDLVLFVGASAVAAITGRRWIADVAAVWTFVVSVALVLFASVTHEAGWGAATMVLATGGSIGAALTIRFGRLPSHWIVIGPFSFRPVDRRPSSSNVAHSLAQLVFFWSTFLIALPLALHWIENRWRIVWPAFADRPPVTAGIAAFAIGSALGLWSCLSMAIIGHGTPLPAAMARELVIVGPYRIVRNPMAVAGALQTIGVGLWTGSWTVIASAFAGGVLWNELIRPHEEADLRIRFGAEYERYQRAVRCWIPSPPR